MRCYKAIQFMADYTTSKGNHKVCEEVPEFCHPKVVVNHSWEVLLDKNIPLVFRGAHNWHKILYTLH